MPTALCRLHWLRIGKGMMWTLVAGPYALLALVTGGLVLPQTRRLFLWTLVENHPVEMLTFAALMAGGILGWVRARRAIQRREGPLVSGFFMAVGLGLVVIAMEEIAWAQSLFSYATPEFLKANEQGEATLHNLPGLQGHSEIMRLVFGLGCLAGIGFALVPAVRPISVPILLLPLSLLITLHASADVINDFLALGERLDYLMQRLSELIEMYIGGGALAYMWLNLRGMRLSPT